MGADKNLVLDGDARVQRDAVLDRDLVADRDAALDEDAFAQIAIAAHARPGHDVGVGPDSRPRPDRVGFDYGERMDLGRRHPDAIVAHRPRQLRR